MARWTWLYTTRLGRRPLWVAASVSVALLLASSLLPSRAPANAKRPWLWLPIQVDGTNAVIPVYR